MPRRKSKRKEETCQICQKFAISYVWIHFYIFIVIFTQWLFFIYLSIDLSHYVLFLFCSICIRAHALFVICSFIEYLLILKGLKVYSIYVNSKYCCMYWLTAYTKCIHNIIIMTLLCNSFWWIKMYTWWLCVYFILLFMFGQLVLGGGYTTTTKKTQPPQAYINITSMYTYILRYCNINDDGLSTFQTLYIIILLYMLSK